MKNTLTYPYLEMKVEQSSGEVAFFRKETFETARKVAKVCWTDKLYKFYSGFITSLVCFTYSKSSY